MNTFTSLSIRQESSEAPVDKLCRRWLLDDVRVHWDDL